MIANQTQTVNGFIQMARLGHSIKVGNANQRALWNSERLEKTWDAPSYDSESSTLVVESVGAISVTRIRTILGN